MSPAITPRWKRAAAAGILVALGVAAVTIPAARRFMGIDPPLVCEAGSERGCACPLGDEGRQRCAPDRLRYGPCIGCAEAPREPPRDEHVELQQQCCKALRELLTMVPLDRAPRYAAAAAFCEAKPPPDKLRHGIEFFLNGLLMPDACR